MAESFGEWLRRERTGRGLTLEALSDRTSGELTHVGIGDWERGKREPKKPNLQIICRALAGNDASPEEVERLSWKGWAALGSHGGQKIEYVPVEDPEFWDAYEGSPQEDQELAKQLLQRARERERSKTIGGKIAQ